MKICYFKDYHYIRWISFVVLLLLFSAHQDSQAAMSKAQIKAAYLFQFTKFSKWKKPSNELVIGIVGEKKMTRSFEAIDGKKIAGRKVKVKWILNPAELQDCCSVIFFANDKKEQYKHYFSSISNKPTLTVLDNEYNESHQGMIRFVQKGMKLKFSVNNTLAQSQSIKLSTFLLQVAIKVE